METCIPYENACRTGNPQPPCFYTDNSAVRMLTISDITWGERKYIATVKHVLLRFNVGGTGTASNFILTICLEASTGFCHNNVVGIISGQVIVSFIVII